MSAGGLWERHTPFAQLPRVACTLAAGTLGCPAELSFAPACSFCLGLLESTSGNGYTALETACLHGHVAPARVLLANGAAVGGADPATAVPLAAACAAGKPACLRAPADWQLSPGSFHLHFAVPSSLSKPLA